MTHANQCVFCHQTRSRKQACICSDQHSNDEGRVPTRHLCESLHSTCSFHIHCSPYDRWADHTYPSAMFSLDISKSSLMKKSFVQCQTWKRWRWIHRRVSRVVAAASVSVFGKHVLLDSKRFYGRGRGGYRPLDSQLSDQC